jgi:DNA invertase Pin-like site-specific DNA recombinase
MSGLARAKAEGITLGRPALEDADAAKVKAIKAALAAGKGIRRIAREHKAGVGTVMRIKAEMVEGRPFDDVGEAA